MENMPIQGADAVILVILLISAIFGFIRGFVKETLSVAGWVGAVFLSLYLFPIAQPIARENASDASRSATTASSLRA